MAELFAKFAVEKGDRLALADEFGETTWAEYNARANQLLSALRQAGIEKGAKIAVLTGKRREYFEALGAVFHGAYIIVPVNWHFVAEEVHYLIEDSDAVVLIADGRFADLARQASDGIEALTMKLMIDGPQTPGFGDYEAFLGTGSPEEPEGQGAGTIMFYTSGTTGRPKGVVSSSIENLGMEIEALDFMMLVAADLLGVPKDGRSLLCGPGYHSAQWAFSWVPLCIGTACIMRHGFDPADILEVIDRYKITNSHMVPTQFVRFLKHRDGQEGGISFDGSSLQVIWHGAAPCSPAIKKDMIQWWGPIITEYYGGTEGGFATIISAEEWLAHPGSVGKPTSLNEILIVGEDGELCAPGEPGTIYQRSLSGNDFEYHKRPDETEKRHLEPGVFTLGDIGFVDKEGYLFLTDRKIDMIISGGVNIYPAEIESALVAHPEVHDIAVFGVPNDEFGEEIKAVVELADGKSPSEDLIADLRAFAVKHLAGYKVPRTWDFSDELPRTPTGKLLKRLLRDPYWEGQERAI